MALRLHHVHVPRSSDVGVLEVDSSGRIALTTAGRQVEAGRRRTAELLEDGRSVDS